MYPLSLFPSPCVGIRTCSDYSPFGVELDGRTVSGGYRFGYQGSEKDNEFKGDGNSYTTEFRQLDPRLGRWLSVDAVIQPWQSSFCSMDNNPLFFNDISGTQVLGDYYNRKGKYLGNDNINDNNVYVADGVDITKKGKLKFKNAQRLNVTHSTFIKFAGVVDQESYGNIKESFALGTTIVNASRNGGVSIESLITNVNFTKAIATTNYELFLKSPDNDKHGISSAINAFLYQAGNKTAIDYSNGALLWEGGEFAAKGANQHKSKFYGLVIPKNHWVQFKNFYKTTGKNSLLKDYKVENVASLSAYFNKDVGAYIVKAVKQNDRVLLRSTAVHGGTIFFGKNESDPSNADYKWKYLSIIPK